jgi:hypothetical protein
VTFVGNQQIISSSCSRYKISLFLTILKSTHRGSGWLWLSGIAYGDGCILEEGLGRVAPVDDVDEGLEDGGHVGSHLTAWTPQKEFINSVLRIRIWIRIRIRSGSRMMWMSGWRMEGT